MSKINFELLAIGEIFGYSGRIYQKINSNQATVLYPTWEDTFFNAVTVNDIHSINYLASVKPLAGQ